MTPHVSYVQCKTHGGFWYGCLWAKNGAGDWKLYEAFSYRPITRETEQATVSDLTHNLQAQAILDGCDLTPLRNMDTITEYQQLRSKQS